MPLHSISSPVPKREEGSGKVQELDGLRGIAIILVIFHHLMPESAIPSQLRQLLYPISTLGWSGVDLFFVLSGFLITGILIISRRENSADVFFINFYLRRALRIFPIYFILIGVFHVLYGRFNGFLPDVGDFKYYYLYVQNWLEAFRRQGDFYSRAFGHLWSLAIEEQFYLVWPMVVWFSSRRVLLWVCLSIVILAPLGRFYINQYSGFGDVVHLYSMSAFTRYDQLVWGALLAVLTARDGGIERRFMCKNAAFVFLGSILSLAGILMVGGWESPQVSNYWMRILGYTSTGGICFSLLYFAAFGDGFVAIVFRRILSWRVLGGIGAISYGMYLYHWPIQQYLLEVLKNEDWLVKVAGVYFGTLVLTVALSLFSFRFVERPFVALKKHFPR